ncbi:MAG TPA: hypothetical protein VFJ70_11285 [Burkholderiales bacterium]|nr:hypothetical protein [Burkholderiales bacterium]
MMRLALLALLMAAHAAGAADTIVITGMRHPVDKSYRKMVQGMDLFAANHALAPQAELRYKVLPRRQGTDIGDVALQLVGDTVKQRVALAADGTFTLGRDAKAFAEDAVVSANRPADTMTWRADIRTPGLPANTRRLGDLRLECQVGMRAGLVSQYPGVLDLFFSAVQSPASYCGEREVRYLFFAERPIFSVALHYGERRQVMSAARLYAGVLRGQTPQSERRYCDCQALLDRSYTLPLGDASWPDDTLVELEPMAAAANDDDPLRGYTRAEARAALGAAKVMRFDSGYEIWAYDWGGSDFMVLFEPDGRAAKSRLRL